MSWGQILLGLLCQENSRRIWRGSLSLTWRSRACGAECSCLLLLSLLCTQCTCPIRTLSYYSTTDPETRQAHRASAFARINYLPPNAITFLQRGHPSTFEPTRAAPVRPGAVFGATSNMAQFILDVFYSLSNCLCCFPGAPQLRINSRSFRMLRLLGEVRCPS